MTVSVSFVGLAQIKTRSGIMEAVLMVLAVVVMAAMAEAIMITVLDFVFEGGDTVNRVLMSIAIIIIAGLVIYAYAVTSNLISY